ncbi:MAG: glycine oxidase ThiO [Pirellulales bacterium]
MNDCLIIGGGVIGLSLAYELARGGQSVTVIDRGPPAREASWAGAGILPPANVATARDGYEQLAALSCELHPRWADELRELTGVDNGYRRCGGIYVAHSLAEVDALADQAIVWRRLGIACEQLDAAAVARCEPALCANGAAPILAAYLLRDEAQLRNPRHLQALLAACHRLGVEIRAGVECTAFETRGDRVAGVVTNVITNVVTGVVTNVGTLSAAAYCVASGAWSGGLLRPFGVRLGVKPIRGQIVLFRMPAPILRHVVNDGLRYLVPRDDGRLLAGSTEEDVGFDSRNTAAGVQGLIDLATSLAPGLAEATIERTWAGLRPATTDGLPLIGPIAGVTNAFCAAGHFRSGLTLSTGTAVVVARLIRGEPTQIDLTSMRPDRAAHTGEATASD